MLISSRSSSVARLIGHSVFLHNLVSDLRGNLHTSLEQPIDLGKHFLQWHDPHCTAATGCRASLLQGPSQCKQSLLQCQRWSGALACSTQQLGDCHTGEFHAQQSSCCQLGLSGSPPMLFCKDR